MSFLKNISSKIARYFRSNKFALTLLIIMIVATTFRFWGIKPGYPAQHPDEESYAAAITMIENNNLEPVRYYYPSGVPLIHYSLFKGIFLPISWVSYYLYNSEEIVKGVIQFPLSDLEYKKAFNTDIVGKNGIKALYWGRYITALFGAGVVFVTFLLGSELFGIIAGLAASFLVAVNFREVLNSHLGLQDIYNAFFLLLTLLFALRLLKSPNRKNYILAGLVNGLYLAIKFQVFGFLPLALAHLFISWKKGGNNIVKFCKGLIGPSIFILVFVSIIVFVLLNPYLLINVEIFRETQIYQLNKYGMGVYGLLAFPYSYLYNIALGKITTLFVLFGFVVGLLKYPKKALLGLVVIFQFFFAFTYYSRGGFYTRNFITIIPLLLIFAGVFVQMLYKLFSKLLTNNNVSKIIALLLVVTISRENITRSISIGREYSKPWNYHEVSRWLSNNLPEGSVIAAHGDTPLPIKDVIKTPYDHRTSFSIDEFRKDGAEYAVSNFSWATNQAYWWIGKHNLSFTEQIKRFWKKPVEIMEYSYQAIAIRELQEYSIKTFFNPWYAPDTDFLVAKLPVITLLSKNLVHEYDFNKDTSGWEKEGEMWLDRDNLDWKNGALTTIQYDPKYPSFRWSSPPIDVANWKGFSAEYKVKSVSSDPKVYGAYIYATFFDSLENAKNAQNRIGVRLSERDSSDSTWEIKELVGQVPPNAKYMKISHLNYFPIKTESYLDWVKVYRSDVDVDLGGVKVYPVEINSNNLFPNSQGNL